MNIEIRRTTVEDFSSLITLHREVAKKSGGIIRSDQEIDKDYISAFIEYSTKRGLSLVAEKGSQIVGEIHAYTPEILAFRHMLSDLTIVVHPDHQKQGIGKRLFKEFLSIVMQEFQHILRVELYVREENTSIVDFYRSLGFINEGRQESKILNDVNQLETPLHMAWFNPNFKPPAV